RVWSGGAGAGGEAAGRRGSMCGWGGIGGAGAPADTSLLLLPTVAKVDQGPPTEDVMLIRDEVANMVWGVETTVPLASGDTAPGIEAARQLRAFLEAKLGGPPPPGHEPTAPVRYQIMSTVPENWIPV